jgi:hypothetical protein
MDSFLPLWLEGLSKEVRISQVFCNHQKLLATLMILYLPARPHMKKTLLSFSALLLIFFNLNVFAQKNLLLNGGFEEGINRWLGDRKVESMDGNKVAVIHAENSTNTIYQAFNGKGIQSVDVKLRYKTSSDFTGESFQIIIFGEVPTSNEDRTSHFTVSIPPNKDGWNEIKVRFDDFRKSVTQYSFKLEVPKSKGTIYFDDIVMTPGEGESNNMAESTGVPRIRVSPRDRDNEFRVNP